MNKRTFDVISISSDDDEDDVPLKMIMSSSHFNQAVKTELYTHCAQQCEFCDDVFLNQYDMLVHNAKHIIIPLLKQTVHQCTECLYYFTSQQELNHHMKLKHNIKPESMINKKLKIELEKFEITKLSDNKLKLNGEDVTTKAEVKSIFNPESKAIEKNTKKSENKFSIGIKDKIKNRLIFEDDIPDCNDSFDATKGLLTDLTKQCLVNINLFDKPWVDVNNHHKSGDELSNTAIDVDDEACTASTHYDELVEPGMYKCERCAESFYTRFQLIQHGMIHIRIRKPRPLLCEYCERFISNSRLLLKQHMVRKHSTDLWNHKQRTHQTCTKCGLKYYNYSRHVTNYHELLYCHLCNKGFDTDEERLDHIREHLIETKCLQCDLVSTAIEIQEHQRLCHRVSSVSTIQICETCCMFVKNKQNMQYVFLENVSELGRRLSCEFCGKMFFELKLVRRLHKRGEREKEKLEKKKYLSNTDRLKNIQQRLKMINKLSRF